jgi:hypothetical protein
VDIDAGLAQALAWCLSNPAKGRKSNYAKFLNGWLGRSQDRGGTRGAALPFENAGQSMPSPDAIIASLGKGGRP